MKRRAKTAHFSSRKWQRQCVKPAAFAAGRSEALKRFLVEDGAGNDPRLWTLAQALPQQHGRKALG